MTQSVIFILKNLHFNDVSKIYTRFLCWSRSNKSYLYFKIKKSKPMSLTRFTHGSHPRRHYYVFRRLLVSVDLWHYNIGIYISLKSNISRANALCESFTNAAQIRTIFIPEDTAVASINNKNRNLLYPLWRNIFARSYY